MHTIRARFRRRDGEWLVINKNDEGEPITQCKDSLKQNYEMIRAMIQAGAGRKVGIEKLKAEVFRMCYSCI